MRNRHGRYEPPKPFYKKGIFQIFMPNRSIYKRRSMIRRLKLNVLILASLLTFPIFPVFPIGFGYFYPGIARVTGIGGYVLLFIGLWILQWIVHRIILYRVENPKIY